MRVMRKLLHNLRLMVKSLEQGQASSRGVTPSHAPAQLSQAEDLHLAIASQFFDAGWYLARYPDVAAAGLDPLTHFLRFGVAEGRDPGPLFDFKWYLAKNPDVAAAGMVPLVHYFQIGAAEGRDPNPSAILRKKIKFSSEQIDLCIPGGIGGKANDYNTIELRTTWRKYFQSQGIGAHKRGDLSASLKNLRSAIQVYPEFDDSFSRFGSVFVEYNREP